MILGILLLVGIILWLVISNATKEVEKKQQEPEDDETSFGNLAIEMKVISHAQLEHALKLQARRGGYLGAILVHLGFLNQAQIDSLVVAQKRRRHERIDYREVGGMVMDRLEAQQEAIREPLQEVETLAQENAAKLRQERDAGKPEK